MGSEMCIRDSYEPMKGRTDKARQFIEDNFALPKGVRKLEELFESIVERS